MKAALLAAAGAFGKAIIVFQNRWQVSGFDAGVRRWIVCFPARELSQSGSTGISHPRIKCAGPRAKKVKLGATLSQKRGIGKLYVSGKCFACRRDAKMGVATAEESVGPHDKTGRGSGPMKTHKYCMYEQYVITDQECHKLFIDRRYT